MQAMTKRILISFLAVLLGLVVISCGGETTTTEHTPNDSVIPGLTNPDAVFLDLGDYQITYRDLYNEVKTNDGLNQLLMLIDEDLLGDYLDNVTAEEIENRTKKLIYGTEDDDEIADMDADELEEKERAYEESMYLLGFGDNSEDYVRLVVARENFAVDQMTDPDNSDEAWYAGPESVAEYYELRYHPDIQTIKIRFLSETDAKSVLRSFNLVSMSGELRRYIGETPLAQVPSSQLNDDNTESLTDSEVLAEFVALYNYVYGDFRDLLATDASLEDLLALDSLAIAYDDLAEANKSLADFVYDTLGSYDAFVNEDDDLGYYTYEPVKYYGSRDTSYYMILNLAKTDKVDVEDFEGDEADLVALIGQDNYDAVEQEIIDMNLSAQSFVSQRMADLRSEHSFALYDYYLGIDYSNIDGSFEVDPEGHLTNLASYDDVIITADDLLTYALNNNAPLYAIYAAQTKAVMAAHFEDVYCVYEGAEDGCEYDPEENPSEKMTEHWDNFAQLEEQFLASYYASYYEFEEYLYLAYGVKNDYEMMMDYYVKATLQPFIIYDEILKDDYAILDELMRLMQPYYDNYFSLKVEHILIYIDRDENGTPDDYEDFYAELEDQAAHDQKLADFKAAIDAYLADNDDDFSELVKAYNKARREDETWGEFKRYGFMLLTESLGNLNYKDSVATYETPFVDALIDLYQDYILENNEDEAFLYATSLVETTYGMHLIKAEQGNDFDKPTANFRMTYDDDLNPEYLPGMVNQGDEITLAQLKIYADYRFSVISYGNGNILEMYGLERPAIPKTVMDAFEAYVSSMYDGLYVVGYLNNIIINQFADATYSHEIASYTDITEAAFRQRLTDISAIYLYQIFAAYDYTE